MISKPTIIISAYCFAPREGSEAGVGWSAAHTLAEEYKVIAICAESYRRKFSDEDMDGVRSKGIQVEFFNDPLFAWILKTPLGGIKHRIYYYFWQKSIRPLVLRLIAEHAPVVLQHVNWGTGKVSSGLVGLGVPVVFGPVGGFECVQQKVVSGLDWKLQIAECLRRVHVRLLRYSTTLRKMYRQIDLVLACTEESASHIRNLGAEKIELMTNAGVSEEMALRLGRIHRNHSDSGTLKLFFASRLCSWKGEEFAIRALARVNDPNVTLTILGSGGNLARCRQLTSELGIAGQIEFIPFLPNWEDVWNLYAGSDVFLFPSLHDSGGTAVLEAMAAGLPVICLDLGGPAGLVDSTCGVKIAPGDTGQIVQDIAEAICHFRDYPEERQQKGLAAIERCQAHFTWEVRGKRLLQYVRSTWDKSSPEPQDR